MKLIRYVNQCERIPDGWGLAWRDWTCQRGAVMPIPLNLLAWLALAVYRGLAMLPPTRLERAMSAQYTASHRDGHRVGYARGRKDEYEMFKKLAEARVMSPPVRKGDADARPDRTT
jgi:hypothetical protein